MAHEKSLDTDSDLPAGLYIIATPIGNTEDIHIACTGYFEESNLTPAR